METRVPIYQGQPLDYVHISELGIEQFCLIDPEAPQMPTEMSTPEEASKIISYLYVYTLPLIVREHVPHTEVDYIFHEKEYLISYSRRPEEKGVDVIGATLDSSRNFFMAQYNTFGQLRTIYTFAEQEIDKESLNEMMEDDIPGLHTGKYNIFLEDPGLPGSAEFYQKFEESMSRNVDLLSSGTTIRASIRGKQVEFFDSEADMEKGNISRTESLELKRIYTFYDDEYSFSVSEDRESVTIHVRRGNKRFLTYIIPGNIGRDCMEDIEKEGIAWAFFDSALLFSVVQKNL